MDDRVLSFFFFFLEILSGFFFILGHLKLELGVVLQEPASGHVLDLDTCVLENTAIRVNSCRNQSEDRVGLQTFHVGDIRAFESGF